jgi:hypothetical protein
MKLKVSLGILLLLVSTFSQAEWIHVGSTAEQRYYMTAEGVAFDGAIAKIWIMTDADAPVTSGQTVHISSRNLNWIDCKKRKFKIVAINLFSGHMGEGKTLYMSESESQQEWTSIPPTSMYDTIFKITCTRK